MMLCLGSGPDILYTAGLNAEIQIILRTVQHPPTAAMFLFILYHLIVRRKGEKG